MTLNEIVYDIWELYRRRIKDDDTVDRRMIANWIHIQRALWISNQLNKGKWDESYVQDFGKTELQNVNTSEISTIPSDTYIKRSTVTIPKLVVVNNDIALTRIGPYDFMESEYTLVPFSVFMKVGSGRFNKSNIYSTVKDSYIYVKSCKNSIYFSALKYINVRGVAENPEDLRSYQKPDGTYCYTDNSDYPLDRKLYAYMKEAIVKFNFPILAAASEDVLNNATDDTGRRT